MSLTESDFFGGDEHERVIVSSFDLGRAKQECMRCHELTRVFHVIEEAYCTEPTLVCTKCAGELIGDAAAARAAERSAQTTLAMRCANFIRDLAEPAPVWSVNKRSNLTRSGGGFVVTVFRKAGELFFRVSCLRVASQTVEFWDRTFPTQREACEAADRVVKRQGFAGCYRRL